MKGYELVFITDPGINDADMEVVLNKFKKSLKDSGGKLIHEHVWGNRRLAYEIKGNEFGVYHAWYFTGTGTTVDELQRQFGYSDNILRNQIVKTNDLDEDSSFLKNLILPKDKKEDNKNHKEINKEINKDDLNKKSEINEEVEELKLQDDKNEVKSEEKIDT